MPTIIPIKNIENTKNKVTIIDSSATHEQYPSAKAVKDVVAIVEASINSIKIDEKYSPTSENAQSGTAVAEATLANESYNNKKINDENNIAGYKGYYIKAITKITQSSIELAQIELDDNNMVFNNKAIYENVKIFGDFTLAITLNMFEKWVVADISTNNTNTILTAMQIDLATQQTITPITIELDTKENKEESVNWLFVPGVNLGEDIPHYNYALSFGYGTIAAGHAALAGGHNCYAFGGTSLAFGEKNIAGYRAIATGLETQAINTDSVSHGRWTQSLGPNSIALGEKSKSIGGGSIATGFATQSIGDASISAGHGTKAVGFYSVALGKFNVGKENTLLEVGNGVNSSDGSKRSNAFEINSNGTAMLPSLKNSSDNPDPTAIGSSLYSVATKGYVDQYSIKVGTQAELNALNPAAPDSPKFFVVVE